MTSSISHMTPQFPSPDPAAHQVHKPAEQVIVVETVPTAIEPAVEEVPDGEEAQ